MFFFELKQKAHANHFYMDGSKIKTCVDTIDCFSYIKLALHQDAVLLKTAERLSRCEIITHRVLMQVISPPFTISLSYYRFNRIVLLTWRPTSKCYEPSHASVDRPSSLMTSPTSRRCWQWC